MPHEPYAKALLGYNDRVLPQPKARPEKERAVNSGAAVYPFPGQLNKSKQKPASNNAGSFYSDTALFRSAQSRVGSDTMERLDFLYRSISIHAPAWGATSNPGRKRSAKRIFQSTLPHGETLSEFMQKWLEMDFNPHSLEV